jgi:hypothetical protein
MKKLLWALLILSICLPARALAAPLFEENFDYTAGDSLTWHGWICHSSCQTNRQYVVTPGLTYAGYPSSGIGNADTVRTTGQDVHKCFTAQTSGTVYYAFLTKIATATTGGDYCMHLGEGCTGTYSTNFWARVYFKINGSNQLAFGLTKYNETPVTYTGFNYSLNTTYLVVVSYTFNTGSTTDDSISLWVNPACAPQPTADLTVTATGKTDATNITSVDIRQGSGFVLKVDGIRVALNWTDVRCGTGSCCYNDGTCAVTLPGDCTGTWTGGGVCDPNPCPQPGECCYADGTCAVTLQSGCTGTWTLGGDCDPNPCPQPGSCCQHADGACTVTFEAACTDPGAVWTLGGVCQPNTCPLPDGACCTQGVCTVTKQAACGGETWTLDGVCQPNPCTQPTGSCCAPDGSCTVTLQAGCDAPSTWTVAGVCVPNTCPLPDGSCCMPDGSCTVTKEAACNGGTWTMFGVCDPNTCAQPDGSCCHPDGSCTVAKLVDCGQPNVWTMFGVCDPNTCPLPTGRCCDIYGLCTVTLQAACQTPSVWTMFGVCDPNTCPPEQGACCLESGLCVVGAPGDCNGLGTYQGAGTTCTPNPCPAPVKTVCQVAEDDANGLALLVGQRVTVHGIALCNDYTWSVAPTSPAIPEFQITDGGCCIDVFGEAVPPNVVTGDSVIVVGTVSNYAGKTEISGPVGSPPTVTVVSSGHVVTPGLATTGGLATAGEPYESCLFTINCVTIVSGTWPSTRVDANIVINDGTGNVTMRLDKDTNCWTIPAPTSPFTVTGIGDQYDTTSPYTTGWQIKPRGPFDIGATCASGACCLLNGNCVVTTPDGCTAQNGAYQGDGTTCPPSPACPPPVGACCVYSGACSILDEAACLALPGVWFGFGSGCQPNPCDQPNGSCCYPNGTCQIRLQASCTGVWTMDGVCTPNTCAQPGACCDGQGVCTMVLESACLAPSTWKGGSCNPNPCSLTGVDGGELDNVLGVRATPNPFAGSVSLRVAGPNATAARVLIFDASGRLVRTAWNGILNGRAFNVTWDGRDDSGRVAATGIYMVRLESGSGTAIGRLVKLN